MSTRRQFNAAMGGLLAAAAPALWAQNAREPRLGLALGAGSAYGFAHIGVLKSLDQAGIRPGIVTGTSAGSLVGVFYAAGFTPWQMEEIALKVRDVDVADLSMSSKHGMLSGEALQKLVNTYLHGASINDFKIPFGAVTTDLQNGEMVLQRSGDAGLAVRASCSIPGVFIPANVNGRSMVDGGITSPLPVRAAHQMGADFVIGVDVSGSPRSASVPTGVYEIIVQSFEIMEHALTESEAAQADLVIRPDASKYASTDFSARREMIQVGYEAAQAALPKLKAALANKLRRKAG